MQTLKFALAMSCLPVLVAQAQTALPDLTIDANRLSSTITFQSKNFTSPSCANQEGCLTGLNKRKLMRFDVATPNVGSGDLVLGNPGSNPALFTYSPCHKHYHFNGYATYELLNQSMSTVLTGRKQAFCLMDVQQYSPAAGPGKYNCSFQGITAGWADVYPGSLDCQWLDVTGIAPGNYYLRVTVNPSGVFQEARYDNNVAVVPVTIPTRIR